MSMRRPRIKVAANLSGIKRKPKPKVEDIKTEATEKQQPNEVEESVSLDNNLAANASANIPSNTSDVVLNAGDGAPVAPPPVSTVADYTPIASDGVNLHMAPDEYVPSLTSRPPSPAAYEQVEIITPDHDHIIQSSAGIRPKSEMEDNSSFKYPPKVDYNRSNSNNAVSNLDDVFHSSDLEENVIQMDLQKSINGHPMSPSKVQARQRIRATPIFGQRRNSFVGSSPSPHTGDEGAASPMDFAVPAATHRRERHYSASHSQTSNTSASTHSHTPHKFTPSMGMGRIRTESGCSTFSDTYAASSKSRKADEHSHRTISRRDFEARFTNGVPDKSALKMCDLIYYNPVTNPMEQKPNIANIKKEAAANLDSPKASETSSSTKVELKDDTNAVHVPQLKLNSNGELIIDDKSLEIETTAEQEARKVLANSSLIFLDENTGMNGFYKRQKRTKEWPPEETVKFYRCLQTIGTDFSLMCQLFPQRTRRDLKLKFKKEERCNCALINKALLYPKIFNIEELQTQLETEEREREEAERKWKEIKLKEATTSKKKVSQLDRNTKTSVAARALQNGDDVYQNENVVKTKLGKRAAKPKQSKKANSKTAEPAANNNNNNNEEHDTVDKVTEEKPKRKRRRVAAAAAVGAPTQQPNKVKIEDVCIIAAPHIKTETIKAEQNPMMPTYVIDESTITGDNNVDSYQLENELTDLLHSDATALQDNQLSSYSEAAYVESKQFDATSNSFETEMVVNSPTPQLSSTPPANHDYNSYVDEPKEDEKFVSTKTFINLDDGTTVSLSNEMMEVDEQSTDSSSMHDNDEDDVESLASNHDLDECDIQQILTELADGSLVLVSTLDPENADKVLNEIYMLDKSTGELCDDPLDIPEAIVHAILSVMS